MEHWDFWDTTVAQVEDLGTNDTATAASIEEWGTKEAAREFLKIQKFEVFIDSVLAQFGITLESVIGKHKC